MASKQSTVDFILEQIAGGASARKMFGEYSLYFGPKLFGLVCDDRLFIKQTAAGRSFLGEAAAEAAPYPGAKLCFVIPGEAWDDAERLATLVRLTVAELPAPKPKPPRRTKLG